MWIGVLWAGQRVAMWIAHVGGKFHHGPLENHWKRKAREMYIEALHKITLSRSFAN